MEEMPDMEMLFFEPEAPHFSHRRRPREGKRVAPNVTAFNLPCSIPSGEEAPSRLSGLSRKNAAFIHRCAREHHFDRPIFWLRCPDQLGLTYELRGYAGIIYDCDKDWTSMPSEWEAALCNVADVVLAASEALQEKLSLYSESVALLPNGLDHTFFSQSAQHFPTYPGDLYRLPHPVFGYLGTVNDFTLLSPVLHAADAHPDWSFVFVGEFSHHNPLSGKVKKRKNIHLLGEKSLSSLPRYLAGFDVCFSLLNERDPDPMLPPQQLYHYLASGKPIVAMSGTHLDAFYSDVIDHAHFDIEFTSACEFALEDIGSQVSQVRLQYSREADWSQRSAKLRLIFETNGFC